MNSDIIQEYPIKTRILFIAPYEGMAKIVSDFSAKHSEVEITTLIGDLDIGARLAAIETAHKSYDVAISRGLTSSLVAQAVSIPVLSVPITSVDILQTLKLAENYSGKFAFVSLSNNSRYVELVSNIMHYSLDNYTISDVSEIQQLLLKLKSEGVSLIIGDHVTSSVAHKLGLNSILLTSSQESIEMVINQAISLATGIRTMKHQMNVLSRALKNIESNLLIYTLEGDLFYSSVDDPEILRLCKEAAGKYYNRCRATDHYSFIYKTESYVISGSSQIVSVDQEQYLYYTFLFRQESNQHRFDYIRVSNPFGPQTSPLVSDDMGIAVFNNDVREKIESFALQYMPVVILGETSTGKDIAAEFLHARGPYSQNPLYTIDCSEYDKQGDEEKPLKTVLISLQKTTIYFRNLNDLSADKYRYIMHELLSDPVFIKNNRILISLLLHPKDNRHSDMLNQIDAGLNCVTVYIPPIRERKEDIQSLSSLYINKLNIETGANVLGFEPRALSLFKKYSWLGNLSQFKRVLRELVIQTKRFYITAEQVEACFDKEKQSQNNSITALSNPLDLNQSLEKIIFDVVQRIMLEENNNQTRTAERLGIGRSTIWRILKSKP